MAGESRNFLDLVNEHLGKMSGIASMRLLAAHSVARVDQLEARIDRLESTVLMLLERAMASDDLAIERKEREGI